MLTLVSHSLASFKRLNKSPKTGSRRSKNWRESKEKSSMERFRAFAAVRRTVMSSSAESNVGNVNLTKKSLVEVKKNRL